MGATYTRQSSFTDGDVITADLFNDEYDQLLAAFATSSGHTHDGTAAEGGPVTKLLGTSITIGDATSGTDITVTFDGESNDGVLKWMEDEDYFEFSDDILVASTEKIQFRDTAIYINSSTDGQLDLVADTEIQIAATTVDINGNVDISGTLTIGSAGISEAELEILDGATVTTAEINIIDGDTSATSTTVADADRVVFNDNGTMVQVAVTDLAAYFDDEITAMPNLVTTAATTVGALNSGSITSGFGTIDTGSSTITTTGLISGGSLDIDDVLINGTTIGHTDDTDLITLANGVVTVAGEISVTTLDIGGTNVTSTATELNLLDGVSGLVQADFTKLAAVDSTAAELNIVDGGTSATSTTVADADRVVMNDNGTMVQVAVTDLAAYFDDEITAMPNLVTTAATTVGALNSGSVTSGFGTIDTGSSTITTTGLISGGSLDIDNVLINGTTIGHTDDTDLITVADGLVTVAGEVSMTTLDIGGTNVSSTAAEINLIDGGTSRGTTAVASGDGILINDAGTMRMTNVDTVSTYFSSHNVGGGNIVTTGALNSGSITSGFGTIDTGSSNITTTGVGSFGSLDISGAIDVDGTTNLDAVDVDGAVNFAADVTFADGADIITASAGISNFRAGVNAGNSIASGGNYNVVVGDEAGTALTTGDNNVAVGYQAGDALTTSNSNVAVGSNSLGAETSGANCTAIGTHALTSQNVDGGTNVQNTAVGYDTGQAITSGIQNTIVGAYAGDALTDADYNVAVGVNALTADQMGSKSTALGMAALASQNFGTATDSHNTAVGYNSGTAVTTGTLNTLIGGLTGDAITTGGSNVALGYFALTADDVGSKSVAIGTAALGAQNYATATDSFNVAVGQEAGRQVTTGRFNNFFGGLSGDAIEDGAANVALGYGTLSTDTRGSHSIAIGHAALENQNFSTAADSHNVAIGSGAGNDITTGINNTLIGAYAGDILTDADSNVAVGGYSLSADKMGSKSTAIGYGSLNAQIFETATDSNNTAVGYYSGTAVTTGVQNTIIGGLCHDNLTTGSLNTAVGYNLGPSAVDVDGEIIIGSNKAGGGANTVKLGVAAGDATLALDGSDTSWSASSDARLKTNVADCAVGLDFIKDLRPITYNWNAKNAIASTLPQYDAESSEPVYGSGKIQHGFLAQEVKSTIDAHSGLKNGFTMWSEDPDGTQQVAPTALIPMLVKAIQELEARIATLEG